jgi:hypothetical protein
MFRLPPRKSNQPQPADEGYSKCFGPDEHGNSARPGSIGDDYRPKRSRSVSARLIRSCTRRAARRSMFVAVLPVVTSPPIRNVHFQMPGSTFRTEYSIPRCSNCNFPFESTVTRLGTGRRPRPFKTEQMAS